MKLIPRGVNAIEYFETPAGNLSELILVSDAAKGWPAMLSRKIPAAAVAAIAVVAVPGVLAAQSADSKYDSGTTMFSPKGRLYQVEYASEVSTIYHRYRVGME